MASSDVQLLTVWVSPYSMRVQVALFLKGVNFSSVSEDLSNKSPLLLKSNPVYKKIPVLIHGGRSVCESLIIVQYVDEAFPSPDGHDLLPKDPYCKAIARFWADFIDKKIFDKFFHLLRNGQDEAVSTELRGNLSTLEEALGSVPKEPPFFGGAKVSYVDIILSPLIAWHEALEKFSKVEFEWKKLPRLAAWMKAMQDSPCAQVLPEAAKVTEFVSKRFQERAAAAQAAAAAKPQT